MDSLRLYQILTRRGEYSLAEWRGARREFEDCCAGNDTVRRGFVMTKGPHSAIAKDYFDEVLGVLYFCECLGAQDEERLEIAPRNSSVFDFKFRGLTLQVTIAIPDWRVALQVKSSEADSPGSQRARRTRKLNREGFVVGSGILAHSLEYVEQPSMQSREKGIAACSLGISCALNAKAEKAKEAAGVADILVIYGAELNAFGPAPSLSIFEAMLRGVTPGEALSAYKHVYVTSSADGWLAQWRPHENSWQIGK